MFTPKTRPFPKEGNILPVQKGFNERLCLE